MSIFNQVITELREHVINPNLRIRVHYKFAGKDLGVYKLVSIYENTLELKSIEFASTNHIYVPNITREATTVQWVDADVKPDGSHALFTTYEVDIPIFTLGFYYV